jgi:hypothetical protein
MLPRVGSRRISVSVPPTRRVLRTGKRWPFSGWKGCRTSAHPKDSLGIWVVRANCRHSELSHPAIRLGYFYPPNRLWSIGPAQELGANLGPVLHKVSGQILDAHRVDAGTTLIGLDSPQCFSTVLLFADLLHHPFGLGRAFVHVLRHGRFNPVPCSDAASPRHRTERPTYPEQGRYYGCHSP